MILAAALHLALIFPLRYPLPMQTRTLGRTGLQVSVVGFGGIPIQGVDFAEAERVLNRALDRGINFFDTARGYTDSEEKIGRALGRRRGEFWLASKSLVRDAEGITAEVETSLRNLRTDCIDLYQLHAVGSENQLERVLGAGGAYEALQRARTQGKIRFIGITGHSRSVLLKAIETGAFDTVQHPFNPIETEWQDDVIPAAKAAGLGLIAMKPAAGGALRNVPAALRFELARGMDVVIPGMDSLAQVDANAAVGLELRAPDVEELRQLEADRELWGNRFCRRCGYCMPCPNGLQIPMLLLLQGYWERYELRDWAVERLQGMEKSYEDCQACGVCVERCPYQLAIPELMRRGAEEMPRAARE